MMSILRKYRAYILLEKGLSENTRKAYAGDVEKLLGFLADEGIDVHSCTLDDLHRHLLRSSRFPYYREMYYKVLPYVVELRQKGGHKDQSELQTCFEALYGVMMLRMQHKPVSDSTAQAAKDIATLLGQLSDYYFKDQAEPINFDD